MNISIILNFKKIKNFQIIPRDFAKNLQAAI